ncbi:MAG: hypothetical protein J5J00_12300, partial [Deltaproteobacteria bacterium]|nr:hypothetical protein [Deltaproteobacteria bacterium]
MPLINFAGIASGIDSNALIDAMKEALRTQRVKPHEEKITELEETNSAFDELKTKLEDLRLMILQFARLNGGALSKTATSTDETAVTASATNAAAKGAYTVTVTQLAKNHTHSFDERFASADDTPFSAISDALPASDRDVVYTVGTGSDQITIDIPVTSTMTVSQYISAFNNHANNNGRATASMVEVSPGSYAIVVSSNFEGTAKGSIYVPPG